MKKIKTVYRIFLFLLLAASIYLSFNINGKNYKGVLHHDGLGYYMYLPHSFIFHSFDLQKGEDITGYGPAPGSKMIMDKYTYGTSVMMLPFFLIAEGYAYIKGMPDGGFGVVYDTAVMMAACFYLVLGMFFLIRSLSNDFKPLVIIISLIAIFAGTNLYYYTIHEPAYSHVYSFFLFSVFIFLTPGYNSNPTWKKTILISLIFGWIFLIRPTNGVVGLYLLLYDIYAWKDISGRWRWVKKHFIKLCLFPVACILWFIPQLIYWHAALGTWQFDGYRNEGFIFWLKPKIFHVLFSVQNGMLIYAPVIIYAIVGLGIAIYRKKFSGIAILIILGISTYVFASWWCWWYGGAYGHRGYIEYFAFMAIPMVYSVSLILKMKPAIKYSIMLIFFLLIVYSLQLNYAYSWPWEGPDWTWQTYGHVVGKAFGLLQ